MDPARFGTTYELRKLQSRLEYSKSAVAMTSRPTAVDGRDPNTMAGVSTVWEQDT